MTEDLSQIDAIFKTVNRSVWVVTSAQGKRRGGLAATYVSQSSLDPNHPQLVAALAVNHFTRELIDSAGAFAAHLLRDDQAALCLNFAIGSGRDRDKLAGIDHALGETGAPLLYDCLARLECKVFARVPAGERIYYFADVVRGEWGEKEAAVLCERELMAAANDDQKQALAANRQADIEAQAPLHEAWRSGQPSRSDDMKVAVGFIPRQ